MQKKQNSVIDIILLALAVILLAAVVGVNLGESSLITELGIRGFRWLSRGLIGGFVLSAVTCGGRLIKRGLRLNQLKMEEQKRLEQAEEQKLLEEKRVATLSVDGEMDAEMVRHLLEEEVSGKWQGCYENIYACIEQMEQMNSYQARLEKLLADNGAGRLRDTEDILNQVEQYICQNVRGVLNFMAVADDEESNLVNERLVKCHADNGALLKQTKDFIYAMADFLNNQGDKTDTSLLECYKNTLQQTMRGGAL